MKTPLKYVSFNCTLVVAPDSIFIVSLAIFFFFARALLSAFALAEIQSATLFHRTIVTLFFDARGFAVVYRFRHAGRSPIKDSSALNIGKNDNAPPRSAVGNIRFSVTFFLVVFFFGFMLMLNLVLTQMAAALSLKTESLDDAS